MIIKEVVIIVKLVLKNPSRLLALIVMRGFNQSQYARHIGIGESYMSYIMNGRRNPAPPTARKIAKGVGKTIPDLFLIKLLSNDNRKK